MNLEGKLINKPFMEYYIDDMSYTPDMNTTPHQVDSAPSSSTNKSRKRKSKDKSFDHMCSNIGAMAELVATMVLKLNGLISELSNGYVMVDLQIKLYRNEQN